ncbi:MAG: hypothetical protein LIO69_08815 [Oscillospiraceae bacterium]|nr:hypothetical protein [Oscillospiraceae bacterium]
MQKIKNRLNFRSGDNRKHICFRHRLMNTGKSAADYYYVPVADLGNNRFSSG